MPNLTMADWTDSFYYFVKSQVQSVNPNRFFGGIVQSRDWPLKEVVPEGFYLLLGQLDPVAEGSWSAPNYSEKVQWIWEIKGTDLTNNVATNRGDRYRTNFQMIQELLQGMFPGFCPKQTWSVEADANNNPLLISAPYNPPESVWWQKPSFQDKYNAQTGILTGAALSSLAGFSPYLSQGQ